MTNNSTKAMPDGQPGEIGTMRMRYVPRKRLRYAFPTLAPWMDLVLLLLYLLLIQSRLVLQPGTVVELPAGRGDVGLFSSVVAVAAVSGSAQNPVYQVYFNDERYLLDDQDRRNALREALFESRQRSGETSLTLYADQRLGHRYVTMLLQMAREAGIQRVNLAVQPLE